MEKHVSVIIATYKRANLIRYTLEALSRQVNRDFEVVVVLCPSNDGTEQLLKRYQKNLTIRVLLRKTSLPVTDAWNIGIANSAGDVVAFLDDDSVPEPQWIKQHIQTYDQTDAGGVAGEVVPAIVSENKVVPISSFSSEIVPEKPELGLSSWPWNRPLPGLEDYSLYLSRSGHLQNRLVASQCYPQKVITAVGANMSFSRASLRLFRFPSDWMPAYACEALLGWHLWKNGYSMIFNSNARVLHIRHGSTLGRSEGKRKVSLATEYELFFYRLYHWERNLSLIRKLLSGAAITMSLPEISVIKGIFHGNLRGLTWLLANKIGSSYNPLTGIALELNN